LDEPPFEAGGDVDQINVALRVGADDLDPSWVTELIGRPPTFAARKGERRPSQGGEVVQSSGVWLYNLPESTEWELGDALNALLDHLPQDLGVWQALQARATIEVFCGLHLSAWNRGAELPARLVARLAERGIAIQLDIYFDGPESD